MGGTVAFNFSTSGEAERSDPRLPEKASVNIRGKKRYLDGLVVGRFCTKFGVERAGVGGWIAGESLRVCGLVRGTRPDRERLRVRGREVGVGVGVGEGGTELASSEGRGVAFPWKTSITDHLLRLRVVLLLPLLCDTDSEVGGRDESSMV